MEYFNILKLKMFESRKIVQKLNYVGLEYCKFY